MSTWRDNLRTIEPYVPGEQPNLPDMIKLNTNENPYPPSPKVVEVLKSFDCDTLRLYPDPNSQLLADALASITRRREKEISQTHPRQTKGSAAALPQRSLYFILRTEITCRTSQ